jgi:hypothetical protein
MIKSVITDGKGRGSEVHIEDNALLVAQYTCPPMIPQKNIVFRQYFTDDGIAGGTSDMLVDGSTTPVSYWIQADQDNDRYITAINIVIEDDGSKLKYFGATNVLTNGCQLFYDKGDQTTVVIHNALKTGWDFFRMSLLTESSQVEINPVKDITAKVDAFVIVMDFTRLLPPYGIKLDAGMNQKIVLRVHDNLTAANMPDGFDAIAYGFDRFE